MLTLSPEAVAKVKEYVKDGVVGLRIGVRGGGCSGLSYAMEMVSTIDPSWTKLDQDDLKIFLDPISAMYLEGVIIDWISLMVDGNSGFKFTNPQVKTTCGCGHSFSV